MTASELLDTIDRITRHPNALNPTAEDSVTPGTAGFLKAQVIDLAKRLDELDSDLAKTRDEYAVCWSECEYLRDRLAEREMPQADADVERMEELRRAQEDEARDLAAEQEMKR